MKHDVDMRCRRTSIFGVRFWAAQRVQEIVFTRSAILLTGTAAISAYYRALGARIGLSVTFRFGNLLLTPDLLDIGDGCISLIYLLL